MPLPDYVLKSVKEQEAGGQTGGLPDYVQAAMQQQQAPAPAPVQQAAPVAQPTPTAGQYGPWQGVAEPALAMGTGLASSAAGGLTAIAGMGKDLYDYAKGTPITFDQSLQKASGRIQGIQQGGTYQPRSDLGKGVTEVVNWPIERATEGWGMIGQGVGNALGDGDAGKALGEVGFQSAAVLAGRPWRAGAAAPITEAGLMNELGQVVNKGFEKGIKPKGVAKTRQEILRERDLQLEAVNSIVKGKEYLKFKDEFGEVIEGKVPKNLDEMSQAVQQRKLQTIEEANKMNLAAGEAGVAVPLTNVMTKLQEIIDNPVLQDNAPHAVNYARKKLKQFEERGEYTPMEAQESMAIFNQSEAIAKANPSRATISNAQVDSLIANNLRADLNAAVEGATGPGYAALRKEFGALKSIEEPVNSRLKKHRQQNENSTLNLYNVFSANDMLQGVGQMASGNVAAGALSAGKGMGLGWIADKIKKGKDPNLAVEKMFTRADDITGKLQKLISEKEAAAVVAEIGPQVQKLLPPPERGFEMRDPADVYSPYSAQSAYSPELAQKVNQLALPGEQRLSLPMPERGFEMRNPGDVYSPYSPEFAGQVPSRKALPPGAPKESFREPTSIDKLFQIAQSPEGMKLLKERLGREEKYSKLLEELSGATKNPLLDYTPNTYMDQTQVWRIGDKGPYMDKVQQYQIQPSGYVQQVPASSLKKTKVYHVPKTNALGQP